LNRITPARYRSYLSALAHVTTPPSTWNPLGGPQFGGAPDAMAASIAAPCPWRDGPALATRTAAANEAKRLRELDAGGSGE